MQFSRVLSRLEIKGVTAVGGDAEFADYLLKLDEDGNLPVTILPTASEIPFTATGTISATDVQTAIAEVASEAVSTLATHAADATLHLTSGQNTLLDAVTATSTEINYLSGVTSGIQGQIDLKAPIASPTFTGTPAAPTAAGGTNTTQIATTEFVTSAITTLIGTAPGALDTLGELSDAINDDASYAATIVTQLAGKASTATLISAGGLATGGGDLSANRTITVTGASQAEAEAGASNTVVMTPLRVAQAIAVLGGGGGGFDPTDPIELANGLTPAGPITITNTYTDATDFERLNLKWDTNVAVLGTEKGSVGGSARALSFQTDALDRLIISSAGLVQFAGTTSSFPALKRSTTKLIARLADDSANTNIEVVDEAYDATSWNGNNDVPTKNAVRDKIESLSVGGITGTDTHVLFFDGADTPAGEAGLTYNKTTDVLTAVGGFVGDLTGNADTATALETARNINGVAFDGTGNITVTAAAGTLTGTEINSTVVTSTLGQLATLVGFGGVTSSFPALKRSTTELQVRLADDSDYTSFRAAATNITTLTATAITASSLTATGSVIGHIAFSDQTNDYTLVLTDDGKKVRLDAATAKTITIPDNATVAFPIGTQIIIRQVGAGTVTVDPDTGVTLTSRGSLFDLAGTGAEAVITKEATDAWSITGDLA